MTDAMVTLPAMPIKARRAPFPWLAATVPMIGGLVLWGVTGSAFSLLFALLGPVIAVASMLDSARGAGRAHRVALAAHDAQLGRAHERIVAHHEGERAALVSRHPDALRLALSPARLWRAGPGVDTSLVLGRGMRASGCRVNAAAEDGGAAESSVTIERLRSQAGALHDAPITIPATGGVMITGEGPFARAAARALVLQLCMTHAPGSLHLAQLPQSGWEWARELPHADVRGDTHRGAGMHGRAGVHTGRHGATPGPVRLVVLDAGDTVASGAGSHHAEDGDAGGTVTRIIYGPPGIPGDPRCLALITVGGADGSAQLTITDEVDDVTVQLMGEAQARTITASLGERAAALFPGDTDDEVVLSMAALLELHGEEGGEARNSARWEGESGVPMPPHGCPLPAPFSVGSGSGAPLSIDIVGDGPHALVAGMTGSGKSELLVSWITALCSLYPPERVVFLLADFKGGTAFTHLAALPHVVGMITDLDAAGARRALESLRAEVRWREARLADAGARDIADGIAEMPRLLVVVDEFAALIAQHPELQELFADLAARGRALGIHLVLGTQRAAGTVRDGLLANIPLRVCLRVVDEADSRTVIGVAGAAALSATRAGAALMRRPSDNAPIAARVVRATQRDRDAARERWAGHPAPRRPWLPPLPSRIDPIELERWAEGGAMDVGLALGLLDEPAAQRQRPWRFSPERERSLLVVGGAGSGKSTALRMAEHAARGAGPAERHAESASRVAVVRVPLDREEAWDAIERLAGWYPAEGTRTLVLIDDLDALIAGLPGDYAALCLARIEMLLREGARTGISLIATAQRMPIAGTRLGEYFNSRLVLRMPHRADHLAAGADGATFAADRPAGRGVIEGTEVQISLPSADPSETHRPMSHAPASTWHPPQGLVGVVSRAPAMLEVQLRAGWAANGAVVVALRTLQPGTRAAELPALGSAAVVVIGDADAWQQHWSLLAAIRAGHPLIIDGGSPSEFRAMTGSRELPPFIAGDAAWLCGPDATVTRVRLPRPRQRWELSAHEGGGGTGTSTGASAGADAHFGTEPEAVAGVR